MAESTDSLYLDSLTFDKKLLGGFMDALIRNTRLVMLIILALVMAGTYAFVSLPREVNPEVDIPIISVVTALPGASPTDVERLITTKIENQLGDLSDLDSMSSNSRNSTSIITLEFRANVDIDKKLADVKDAIDSVSNDLPEDATDPRVAALDFNEQPVLTAAVYGDTDRRSLGLIATRIEDALESTPGISKANLEGKETEQISVILDAEALGRYNLTANAVISSLAQANITIPAGTLNVHGLDYTVSLNNEFDSIESVRSLPISVGQQVLPLSEVADVYYKAQETDSLVYRRLDDGTRVPAVNVYVYKADNQTVTGVVESAETVMRDIVADYPGVESTSVLDLAQETDDSFAELVSNFQTTLLLVFIILFLFIGMRQAAIASLSIPLTFLSAFVIMQVTGITFNFLSLFSLLIGLGLVVDDAIVIVQAVSRYGAKFEPRESALMVYRDFVVPIWTTTLTTIWAFVPLLLATGIIGQFIRSIPIVVTATLLSSTTIAVFINIPLSATFAKLELPGRVKTLLWLILFGLTLALVMLVAGSSPVAPLVGVTYALLFLAIVRWKGDLLPARKHHVLASERAKARTSFWSRAINEGVINFEPVSSRYQHLLKSILPSKKKRRQVYLAVGGFIVASIIFAVSGLLTTEFFPKTDAENMYINLRMPAGTPRTATDAALSQVEELVLEATPEIATLTSQTGQSFDPNGGGGSGSNRGYLSVVLVQEDERDRSSIDIAQKLRDIVADFEGGDVSVIELSGGPPAGADFQANIKGNDLVTLERIANDFMKILEETPGAINVDSSLELSPGEVRVNLDPVALQERGLSAAFVGGWLRTAVSGTEATDVVLSGDDETEVRVELADAYTSLSHLQQMPVPGTREPFVLSEVATFSLEISPVSIVREDGVRVVRVTAGADNVPVPQLLAAFREKADAYEMPEGYTWDVGGANEENNESVQSIIQAMGLSAILILITMVLQLNSFRKAALVLAVIPLAVAGVFFNFSLFAIDLSFPALIGVLALFGIVVNNAIMLTEKINQNLKQDFPFYEAIADACASRLEPILLTTLTTTAGLLPITLSDPLWRGLGGAIIAGLSVSGLLILVVLPTLFVEVYKGER